MSSNLKKEELKYDILPLPKGWYSINKMDKNKTEIKNLKAIKIILESLFNHNQFNFMALHVLGYSSSPKEWFNAWKLKRQIKKLSNQIEKMEGISPPKAKAMGIRNALLYEKK